MLVLIYKAGGLVYKKVKLWGQLNRNSSRKKKKDAACFQYLLPQKTRSKYVFSVFNLHPVWLHLYTIGLSVTFLLQVTLRGNGCKSLFWDENLLAAEEDIYPLAAWQHTFFLTFKLQFVFDSQILRGVCKAHV